MLAQKTWQSNCQGTKNFSVSELYPLPSDFYRKNGIFKIEALHAELSINYSIAKFRERLHEERIFGRDVLVDLDYKNGLVLILKKGGFERCN